MTINCKGALLDLGRPKIMAILNATPDSFFDADQSTSISSLLNRAEEMLEQGASILDIGGYSSKPNADFVSEQEELNRIVPIISDIAKRFPDAIISIDTFRSSVAKAAVENGAAIVNDISAGTLDSQMLQTVATLQVPYIMMHMRGNPQTMQQLTDYKNLTKDLLFYFSQRIAAARQLGISDIIIDPGFGFAKTTTQNFELMRNLEIFNNLELPVLVGISRKSMIYKTFDTTPQEALNGTTALHMVALQKGAKILRVHDVKQAAECIKIFNLLHEISDDDTVRSSES